MQVAPCCGLALSLQSSTGNLNALISSANALRIGKAGLHAALRLSLFINELLQKEKPTYTSAILMAGCRGSLEGRNVEQNKLYTGQKPGPG